VLYGSSNNTSLSLSAMSSNTNTRGFRIIGEGFAGIDIAGVADVNGDGLDDVLLQSNAGGRIGTSANNGAAWVVFGKTDNNTVSVSDIEAGSGGFAINVGLVANNYGATVVSSAGDFNGDGLADMIVTHGTGAGTLSNAGAAFLIYGKTGTSTLPICR
jgi:hypothetical protein